MEEKTKGTEGLATGLWKFKDYIPAEELEAVAEEWAKDDNYIHVYIRKCSKDQYGIGFAYKCKDGTKSTFDKFTEETKDMLYKKFGTGLAGWDISSTTNAIKGFDMKG